MAELNPPYRAEGEVGLDRLPRAHGHPDEGRGRRPAALLDLGRADAPGLVVKNDPALLCVDTRYALLPQRAPAQCFFAALFPQAIRRCLRGANSDPGRD